MSSLETRPLSATTLEIQEPEADLSDSSVAPGPWDLPAMLDAYERAVILASLAAADGHQRRAARLLGIGATTLSQKMKRLDLRGVALLPTVRGVARADPNHALGSGALGPRDEFRWRGRLPAGHRVEVKAVNGDIRVEPAAGDTMEVVALKYLASGAPPGVSIEIVVAQLELGLNISAHYSARATRGGATGDPQVVSPSHFPPPEELRVTFLVRVPRDITLDVQTLNGDIQVLGVVGRIRAESARGSVYVSPGRPR